MFDAGGVAAYDNLDPYHEREFGYAVYCAILKIRWANRLIRDLRYYLPMAERHFEHPVDVKYDILKNVSTVQVYANKFGSWFSYTMIADIISNLRNAFDYAYAGIYKASPAAGQKRLPVIPIQPSRDELEKKIRTDIGAPLVDRAVGYYLNILKPWNREEGFNSLFAVLNELAREVRHNRLSLFESGLPLAGLTFRRLGLAPVKLSRPSIAPGGVATENFAGQIVKVEGCETLVPWIKFSEQPLLADVEVTQALERLSDMTKNALNDLIASFPEDIWFRDDLETIYGKSYNEAWAPLVGPPPAR